MLFRFTARTNAPKQRIEDQMQVWHLAHMMDVSHTLNSWRLFFLPKCTWLKEWQWLKTECLLKIFLRLMKFLDPRTHGNCIPQAIDEREFWPQSDVQLAIADSNVIPTPFPAQNGSCLVPRESFVSLRAPWE